MKILQICHRVPYPPIDGANIAMANLAFSLNMAGAEVVQFALNTSKHFIPVSDFPSSAVKQLHLSACPVDTKITLGGALGNLFRKDSYNVSRFYSKETEAALEKLIREHTFDIVQLETLFTTPYIPVIRKHSAAKIVLRAHNVEHLIWKRLADSCSNLVRRSYLSFLTKRLNNYEQETLQHLDAIVPITPVDEAIFKSMGFSKPMLTVPLGVDLADYELKGSPEPAHDLFHLGSMDWMPNKEGVEWFLRECWPAIHRRFPDLLLHLAGRQFPQEIRDANHPNVSCEGRIDNAKAYMLAHQMMVVPLLSGSGMRVKIIQGLALGRTIISTTIGAEGIAVTNGKNILIADTPAEFLEAIRRCLSDPSFCRSVGSAGRVLVEENYSNTALGRKLKEFYSEKVTGS